MEHFPRSKLASKFIPVKKVAGEIFDCPNSLRCLGVSNWRLAALDGDSTEEDY